jgi:NMD protein affecting ribosome stability and mRNA decay
MSLCEKRHEMSIETVVLESGDELEIEYCRKCKIAYVSVNDDWEIEPA